MQLTSVRLLPAVHYVADRLATLRQRRYLRLVVIELTATVGAAIVSQGSALFPDRATSFELLSAACLGVAIAMQLLSQRAGWNRDWFEDRGVAEASVSASWRYVARISPFDTHDEPEERFTTLLMKDIPRGSSMLSAQVADLGRGAFEPTSAMSELRHAAWPDRAARYAEQRLRDQQRWYAARASQNGQRERWFWSATLAANIGAVVFLVLRFFNPALNVTGVFTTLAASLIAWSNTRRFHELKESYTAVSAELDDLATLLAEAEQEDDFRRCVSAAEEAINREHLVWIVRRVPRHPTRPRL